MRSKLKLLWMLVAIYCSYRSTVVSMQNQDVEIKGWTDVDANFNDTASSFWPVDGRYFIAAEEKHHFIEVHWPGPIEQDVSVKLEFYYNHRNPIRGPSIVLIMPCEPQDIQVDRVTGPTGIQQPRQPGQWLTHEHRLDGGLCANASYLFKYDVQLHERGDIFAWRKIQVQLGDGEPVTAAPTGAPSSTQPLTTSTTTTTTPPAPSTTTSTTTTTTTRAPPTTTTTTRAPPPTTTTTRAPTTTTTTERPTTTTELLDDETPSSVYEDGESSGLSEDEKARDSTTESLTDTTPDPATDPFTSPVPWQGTKWYNRTRKRRSDGSRTHGATKICQPDSCDDSAFKFNRFTPVNGVSLLNGFRLASHLWRDPSSELLYRINDHRNQPLVWMVPFYSDSISEPENDVCIKFCLYMDRNCSLHLTFEANGTDSGPNKEKTLKDVIEAGDEAGWFNKTRCLSDFTPDARKSSDAKANEQMLKVTMRPKQGNGTDRMIVIVDKLRGVGLTRSHRRENGLLPDFIPDFKYITASGGDINNYWYAETRSVIIDDRLRTPTMEVRNMSLGRTANETDTYGAALVVRNFEHEDYLNITSRWLQIDKSTLIQDDQLLFIYRVKNESWLSAISFYMQFNDDEWRLKKTFTRPFKVDSSNGTKTANWTGSEGPYVPIKIKGRPMRPFRFKLSHSIARPQQWDLMGPSLKITELSFGDICREVTCQNGECVPTGPTQFECRCPAGHSGRLCQEVNACSAIQLANFTGEQLCTQIGSKCVQHIPKLRCVWPNDTYVHYVDTDYTRYLNLTHPDHKRTDHGACTSTIIILSIMIGTLAVLFAVLLGVMFARYKKAMGRLQESEVNLYELNRRYKAPAVGIAGNGRATGAPGGSGRPIAAYGAQYNNDAFNMEQ